MQCAEGEEMEAMRIRLMPLRRKHYGFSQGTIEMINDININLQPPLRSNRQNSAIQQHHRTLPSHRRIVYNFAEYKVKTKMNQ